jgi:ABC-type amino acid transport substrate-binding protein
MENFFFEPLKDKNSELTKSLQESKRNSEILEGNFQQLSIGYNEILKTKNAPTLIAPVDNASIIGSGDIEFKWASAGNNPYEKFMLEILNAESVDSKKKTYNIIHPERQLIHIPASILGKGLFFWRIIPGYHNSQTDIITGAPSNYHMLSLYTSFADRIVSTKQLRIATSPTLTGVFYSPDENGAAEGLDVEIANLIAQKLPDYLPGLKKVVPEITFTELPWDQLLPSLIKSETDIVLSAMTATKQREAKNPGIIFSTGYAVSNQVLISREKMENCTLSSIKGKTVGIVKETTNEKAANRLLELYPGGFKINTISKSYDDIYQSLQDRSIDFGLVDDAYILSKAKPGIFICDKVLQAELNKTDFYKNDIGFEKEYYAIAIFHENADTKLIDIINTIFSKESKTIECLNKKWMSIQKNRGIRCG